MNAYGMDLSFLEFGVSENLLLQEESSLGRRQYPNYSPSNSSSLSGRASSPPKHRHDGTSPLPLGMDWSPPPRIWDGRDTVWPHDPRTGWSYCVTIPSWTVVSNANGSGPVVFYRVQVGIQTPEAVTTARGILHRFSDFLKLSSELSKAFPKKNLPVPPPRRLLGTKSSRLIEERRSSLEDWMEKLLSDIDVSRSAPVAIFLELEAAARSSFNVSSGNGVTSFIEYQMSSDIPVAADGSSIASDYGHVTGFETSEAGTPRHGGYAVSELSREESTSDIDLTGVAMMSEQANGGGQKALLSKRENDKVMTHLTSLPTGDAGVGVNSFKATEISKLGTLVTYGEDELNFSGLSEVPKIEDMQFASNLIVALPSEQRHRFSRVFVTMQQRLATAKADMEDLVARLNQELAVRQYLATKVRDLEVELDTTKENAKDSLHQAVYIEQERFTQMQWDMEELRKKCLEMELKFKAEQERNVQMESKCSVITNENEMLMQELDATRKQLQSLQQLHEESEIKSKTDVKVLVKEVRTLRSSQSELKQELGKLIKENLELERILQNEKQRRERASSIDEKLLHECAILRKRLQEIGVDFRVEEEDKLMIDAASTSDAEDLLNTSDNRIGLLLAEAQLLAQDVENSIGKGKRSTEDELKKMLTDMFIDTATLRKQINSAIRCAFSTHDKSEQDDEEHQQYEEAHSRETVLSKFL